MTDRKAYDDKYNASAKGQLRNRAYEARHPERRNRNRTGFIARDALRRSNEPDTNTASHWLAEDKDYDSARGDERPSR